jgi:CHAT domain
VQRIALPTADRTLPSTVAAFPFETGGEGPLTLRIAVLHQGRFVQAAAVVAAVRAAAVAGDRVQLVPLRLSSSPEPAAGTAADVSLDTTTPGRIEHRGTPPAGAGPVLLEGAAVAALLDEVEQRASAVFTEDDVTTALDEEPTRSLLMSLARLGSRLRERLDDLLIGDDVRAIDVLVANDAKVFPFELVYDGPAPRAGARLCRHATRPPKAGGAPCSRVSTAVVCPYAFWGMHRTIIRTIQAPAGRRLPRPAVAPLSARPVLYAAAERADAESPDDARPSDLLEKALAEDGGLTRVTSWTAWRRAVGDTRPEMLVVLGHTDVADHEVFLEIGRRSHLRQADLDARVVVADGAPPPLVVLLACASAVSGDPLGPLPATFTDRGAVAVVATLSKLTGPDGAKAAASVVGALRTPAGAAASLSAALTHARRSLLADGLLIGLVLVAHGDVDLELVR